MELKTITTTGIIFGVAIIIMTIMTQIVKETRTTQAETNTNSVINESLGNIIGNSSVNVETITTEGFSLDTSSVGIFNTTTPATSSNLTQTLSSGNYTVYSNGTILFNNLEGEYNKSNAVMKINYSYKATSLDYKWNISSKGLIGQSKLANWNVTIGLVLGAILVITTLSILFAMRFRKEE